MNGPFVVTGIRRIIYVGENEYTETVTSFPYSHGSGNELIYHLSGEAAVSFNGQQLYTTTDTIRFLPQGDVWEYVVRRKKPGACIDIVFDTDTPVFSEALVLKIAQSEKIKGMFKKIFSIWVAKNEGYYFECVSILYKIFAELQKKNYMPDQQFAVIRPAIEYISEHFLDAKISVDALAAICGISHSYLKKLFVVKFGVPPSKYIIQLKINYACDLLHSKRYTITQISEMCGYRDIYFFSRQFKEYMGISPSEFINKYKSSK